MYSAAPVEAPAPGHVPRVFSWVCGDYGCLGHGIQADEGSVFANNHPVPAVAGGNCTLVLTRNCHVYFAGKHMSTGVATMRPSLVDALANNGHVATCVGAGSQTVFCATRGGVTVSWVNEDEKKRPSLSSLAIWIRAWSPTSRAVWDTRCSSCATTTRRTPRR